MVISYLCDATTTNIAVNDVKSVSSPKSLGVCKLVSMREIRNGMVWPGQKLFLPKGWIHSKSNRLINILLFSPLSNKNQK
jgi:hypothetical protein